MKKQIILELIVFVLIALFVYTGLTKLAENELFLSQVGKSFLLHRIAKPVAIGIPLAELATGLLLMVPRWRLVGLYASFGLMLLFTLYVATILWLAPQLPCACGGIIELLGWTEHLVLNIALVMLSGLAIGLSLKTEPKLLPG